MGGGITLLRLLDSRLFVTPDRARAIKAQVALEEFIEGIATTIPFHLDVLGNSHFQRGQLSTDFIQLYYLR